MSDLHTDILCWLSLLGSIFTPRDFSSVIFFTVGEFGTHSWPHETAKGNNTIMDIMEELKIEKNQNVNTAETFSTTK